jgi:hypothetical protein
MTKADLYQFIAKQKLGVLGTISSVGSPQSALVGIAEPSSPSEGSSTKCPKNRGAKIGRLERTK